MRKATMIMAVLFGLALALTVAPKAHRPGAGIRLSRIHVDAAVTYPYKETIACFTSGPATGYKVAVVPATFEAESARIAFAQFEQHDRGLFTAK
jgi:hypothetical protein